MQKWSIMDLLIEKELLKIKTHIIDYATLKSILINLGYTNINDKINSLKRKGIITSLKKGMYIHTSSVNNNIVSKEIISNNLLDGPSYISLDYALYYYGLIPEAVHEVTAVTTKRSKKFNTDFGIFSYKQIKKELFNIGLKIETSAKGSFLIAGKAKAICDKVYFTKEISLTSKQTIIEFLTDDIRMDIDDLPGINKEVIESYYAISKSKKIKLLMNFIKEL